MASDIDWEAASRIQTRSLSASLTDDCYCTKILSEPLVSGQLTLKFLQAAFAIWMRIHCVDKQYNTTIYVVFPVLVKLRRLVWLKRVSGYTDLEVTCTRRFALGPNDLQVMFKSINLSSQPVRYRSTTAFVQFEWLSIIGRFDDTFTSLDVNVEWEGG
jgi:hypothetical protein